MSNQDENQFPGKPLSWGSDVVTQDVTKLLRRCVDHLDDYIDTMPDIAARQQAIFDATDLRDLAERLDNPREPTIQLTDIFLDWLEEELLPYGYDRETAEEFAQVFISTLHATGGMQ